MAETSDELRSYKLPTEQVEALLANEYGGRIQPVDTIQLAKLKLQHKINANWTSRFSPAKPAE